MWHKQCQHQILVFVRFIVSDNKGECGRWIWVALSSRHENTTRIQRPANTRHCTNDGFMLAHRLRRWPNINPTFVQRLVFAGTRTLANEHLEPGMTRNLPRWCGMAHKPGGHNYQAVWMGGCGVAPVAETVTDWPHTKSWDIFLDGHI